MSEKIFINEYITVPDWVLDERLDLSLREVFILSIIFGYSKNNQGAFWGSLEYLCKMTRSKSKKSVIDALNNLIKKNLLTKRVIYDPLKKCIYTAVLPDWVSFNESEKFDEQDEIVGVKNTPSQCKNYTESVQNLQRDGVKNTPNNTIYIKEDNTNNNSSLFSPLSDDEGKDEGKGFEQEIIDEFNKRCSNLPKVSKLTPQRKKAINARLKDFDLKTVYEVFDKAQASDFLSGKTTNWKAKFDWLMNPNNFIKVLEDNYKNSTAIQKVGTIWKQGGIQKDDWGF